jgi:glycosyltransferase involved in cell wall biosynthesis
MTIKTALVSLVHNRKHLLGQAVQSALDQTLPKDEWVHILVDNGSTDGAEKTCEMLSRKHAHVRLIKMGENAGQQRAFNRVMVYIEDELSSVEYLVNLDSDDKLMPNALEEVKKMFDSHPEVGQVYSGFHIIDGKGNIKHRNHPKAKLVPNQFTEEGQKRLRKIFLSQNPVGHIRAFRIRCLKDIGGFNTNYQYATDYNAAGRMLQKYPVVKIDKVLYLWRQHNDQVERQHSPQQTKDWKDMQAEFRKIFSEKGLV